MTSSRLPILLALLAASPALARTWTDQSGQYSIDADLVAYDSTRVVLKRDSDGELGMVSLERLSAADQEFVGKQLEEANEQAKAGQLWTLRGGLEIPGQVVDFTHRDVTVQRRRGKVYVNDRVFENLPAVYRKVVPMVVAEQTGANVTDEKSLENWLVHRKGQPQTFGVDGVVIEFANGDEYALPFFVFSDRDLEVLQPGWDSWLAAHNAADTMSRGEHSLALQARASQRDALEAEKLRIAQLQLGMTSVVAGVTSLWEVTLYPGPGVAGPPQWVVVPGRDSRVAAQGAMANYPGYVVGPIRRVSR